MPSQRPRCSTAPQKLLARHLPRGWGYFPTTPQQGHGRAEQERQRKWIEGLGQQRSTTVKQSPRGKTGFSCSRGAVSCSGKGAGGKQGEGGRG